MTSKDVHNMVYRLRQSKRQGDLHERVRVVLEDFSSTDGNVVRVYKGEDDTAHCITLATKNMRRHFSCFGEILIIDSTHGTNSSQYKLMGMMVHDAFGHGQFVQHAVIDAESSVNMSSAFQAFKETNPQWADIVKVVMVR